MLLLISSMAMFLFILFGLEDIKCAASASAEDYSISRFGHGGVAGLPASAHCTTLQHLLDLPMAALCQWPTVVFRSLFPLKVA